MPGLQQIQDMLERMLGTYPMPAHYYFWRGKTRDELVGTEVFGASILVSGKPDEAQPVARHARRRVRRSRCQSDRA